MALLKCPECKKKFSDKAAACPSCGAPLSMALEAKKQADKNTKKNYVLIGAIAVAFLIFSGGKKDETSDSSAAAAPEIPAKPDPQLTEIKMRVFAQGFVESALKDPESATYRNQRGVCGEVNAKNGFGGFTGYRRYVAVSKDLVAIEGESLKGSEFRKVWNQACK
ncbi:hypothetical protein [Advenella sp. FME57]|uniref:hypothetical protein n=1 Tax=Advenella sp. FME57 TaxID=2742604 RepID=UPI001D031777|nr:hypothetical protein [Advenella sp. FME57]